MSRLCTIAVLPAVVMLALSVPSIADAGRSCGKVGGGFKPPIVHPHPPIVVHPPKPPVICPPVTFPKPPIVIHPPKPPVIVAPPVVLPPPPVVIHPPQPPVITPVVTPTPPPVICEKPVVCPPTPVTYRFGMCMQVVMTQYGVGLQVVSVELNGPAALAGLRPGQVLLTANNQSLSDAQSNEHGAAMLQSLVAAGQPAGNLALTVLDASSNQMTLVNMTPEVVGAPAPTASAPIALNPGQATVSL